MSKTAHSARRTLISMRADPLLVPPARTLDGSVGRRRGCESSALLAAVRMVERRLQRLCQLRRVVVGPEVHVEEAWHVQERVIVDRRHVDAVLPKRLGHGVHFLVDQYEIPGDGRFAVARRLKVHYGHDAHRWQERLAHLRDRFRSRDGDLEDAGTDIPPGAPERLLDRLRVQRGPGAGAAAGGPPSSGVPLTERAWWSARAICTASPCPL